MFRLAEPIEELVTEAVFHALDTPQLTKQLRAYSKSHSQEADLLGAIKDEESKLEELATDHYDKRVIGKKQYLAVRDRIEGRLEQLRGELAKLDHGTVLAHLPTGIDELRKRWKERGLPFRGMVFSLSDTSDMVDRGNDADWVAAVGTIGALAAALRTESAPEMRRRRRRLEAHRRETEGRRATAPVVARS